VSTPPRVAVVGAGPAGFFTAAALLAGHDSVQIDLIDSLPTPYGLVRYGVAPDHQKIKSVVRAYERTAASDRVRFLGNVVVGDDPTVEHLLERYDQVALCVGTPLPRDLGVPGETLPGSYAATHFVAWYNGHPAHQHHRFDLATERAVVVGMGNVALDVARVLLKGAEALQPTDIGRTALEALGSCEVREVVLLGRRGAPSVAYTPTELADIADLPDVHVVVDPSELELDAEALAWVEAHGDKTVRRNLDLLGELAQRPPTGSKRLVLKLRRSPVEVLGDERVEGVSVAVNDIDYTGVRPRPTDTGQRERIDAGVVLRAVGYRGSPIPGVPFDAARGVIRNQGGRVQGEGGVVPRLYVAGWAKRGPQGVIGTNRVDAKETVAAMLADLQGLPTVGRPGLHREGAVSWTDWERLDRHELSEGERRGRVREKVLSVEGMLDLLS
jgi:ferredoxin--NADP+ reductase